MKQLMNNKELELINSLYDSKVITKLPINIALVNRITLIELTSIIYIKEPNSYERCIVYHCKSKMDIILNNNLKERQEIYKKEKEMFYEKVRNDLNKKELDIYLNPMMENKYPNINKTIKILKEILYKYYENNKLENYNEIFNLKIDYIDLL